MEHTRFVAPKRPQHAFGVEHYAGRVTYSAEYLLEKNKVCITATHPYCQCTGNLNYSLPPLSAQGELCGYLAATFA